MKRFSTCVCLLLAIPFCCEIVEPAQAAVSYVDANVIDKQHSRNLDPVTAVGIETLNEPELIGDFDSNGRVDFKDFVILAAAWLSKNSNIKSSGNPVMTPYDPVIVTGTGLDPNCSGTYIVAGQYNGNIYYSNGTFVIWLNGDTWYISYNLGDFDCWYLDGVTYPNGSFVPQGEIFSGEPFASSGWELGIMCEPSILYEDGTFKMWYRGGDAETSALGYATSIDGNSWTKYPYNPILLASVRFPSVTKINGTYYMLATNYPVTQIYKWHNDSNGINGWVIDNGGNPILSIGYSGQWDDDDIPNPVLFYDAWATHPWKILYQGAQATTDWRLGYAYSDDGNTFTKSSANPVIPQQSGGWRNDGVRDPSQIYKSGNQYYVMCTGNGVGTLTIGAFTSTDFNTWTEVTGNPQFSPEQDWEGCWLSDPDWIFTAGATHKIYLYYIGGQSSIGMAYSDLSLEDFILPRTANWNAGCDISMPSDGIIDELDLAVFCDNWLETF